MNGDSKPLNGRIALITGAGTGIGRAAAIALAGAGCSVSLIGRRGDVLAEVADSIQTAGAVVQTFAGSVADRAAVDEWVRVSVARFGGIDILVNSAGTNIRNRGWSEVTVEAWNDVVDTNLNGVFLCTYAVLPHLRARGGGLILNVASIAGRQASVLSGVAYSASKFGVVALTQSLNLEEWRNGIRATCILPGDVDTPIMDRRPRPPPQEARRLMVQPDDLGATVVFLATLPARALIEELVIRPVRREY